MTANLPTSGFHLRNCVSVASLIVVPLLATSCGGFDSSKNSAPGTAGSGAELSLNEVSNGFGQLLPHTVFRPGTNELVPIRTAADITANVMRGNPIQPTV
ncbi:MAG: hypothetical protein AAGG01_21140, partial [Planctomycetota bacterium]